MQENRINGPEESPEQENKDRFQSDTQKIIRRHLEDENDVITDEDIRNVRVGLVPPGSETMDPEKADEQFDALEEELKDREEPETTEGQKLTPWDVKED